MAPSLATAPLFGVTELVTPPGLVRASQVQDRAAPALLDLWFESDYTDAAGLRKVLEEGGFTILFGDGESFRVRAPEGRGWPDRLAAVPEVRRVAEALDRDRLSSGAYREGSERYGELLHTWSWVEGGPQQSYTGAKPPLDPVFPVQSPPELVRCLSPLRSELLDGVATGPGWERALLKEPGAWALVLQDYGACDATGWLALSRDGSLDTLTVGDVPVQKADSALWWRLAGQYLSRPRYDEDAAAIAAFDLLRKAPDEVIGPVLPQLAPTSFQLRLYDSWSERNPGGAGAVAVKGASPLLLARGVSEDGELRKTLVSDPNTPSRALEAALSAWRATEADSSLLEQLRLHRDPTVRRLAWERWMDLQMAACSDRAAKLDSLDAVALAALYRDCPQQPVRSPAFSALIAKDRQKAAEEVARVLEAPETLLTGIAAVRAANVLERDDLLEALVQRDTVARDIRRVALELLTRAGRSANATELSQKYGAYLGYRPLPAGPVTVGP